MSKRALTALAVLIAVIFGLSWYIYGLSSGGIARMFGSAAGSFLLPGLIAAAVSKRRGRPVRWDLALAVTVVLLILAKWETVYATYDARQFQAEIKNAGSDRAAEIIRQSKTRIGAAMRELTAIQTDSRDQIARIFDDVSNDLRLVDSLSPKKVMDLSFLRGVVDIAKSDAAKARAFPFQVRNVLAQEASRIATATSKVKHFGREIAEGANARSAAIAAFAERRADILARTMDHLATTAEFLVGESGSYFVDGNQLRFMTRTSADAYNALLDQFKSLAEEDTKLDAEINEYERRGREELMGLSN